MLKTLRITKKFMLYIYLPLAVIISFFTDSGAFYFIAAAVYILMMTGCNALLKKYSVEQKTQEQSTEINDRYLWVAPTTYVVLWLLKSYISAIS